jgi:hypothetical protein
MRRADARRHRRVRRTANTQYDVVGVDSRDPEFNSRFAERLAAVSDVTGDGVPDVFASTFIQDIPRPRREPRRTGSAREG